MGRVTFKVVSAKSGQCLGTYSGETPEECVSRAMEACGMGEMYRRNLYVCDSPNDDDPGLLFAERIAYLLEGGADHWRDAGLTSLRTIGA